MSDAEVRAKLTKLGFTITIPQKLKKRKKDLIVSSENKTIVEQLKVIKFI